MIIITQIVMTNSKHDIKFIQSIWINEIDENWILKLRESEWELSPKLSWPIPDMLLFYAYFSRSG